MLKVVQFDLKIIYKTMVWRVFYALFLVLFALSVPYSTYDTLKSNNPTNFIGQTPMILSAIFVFLSIAAPVSKNMVSKMGGNYSQIIFSLPVKKSTILNGKFLSVFIYGIALCLYVLVLSLITMLILNKQPTAQFILSLIVPIFSNIVFFGTLYLFSFFTFKSHTTFSMVVYVLSIFGYMAFANSPYTTAIEPLFMVAVSLACAFIAYILSRIFYRQRSY